MYEYMKLLMTSSDSVGILGIAYVADPGKPSVEHTRRALMNCCCQQMEEVVEYVSEGSRPTGG